jgi:hypothetical protein
MVRFDQTRDGDLAADVSEEEEREWRQLGRLEHARAPRREARRQLPRRHCKRTRARTPTPTSALDAAGRHNVMQAGTPRAGGVGGVGGVGRGGRGVAH